MKFSLNWIKEFVSIDDIDVNELANKLTMSTAEVEEVIPVGNDIQNVVVGKIVDISYNERLRKLSIVRVDIGNEIIQCTCGAKNVQVGMIVPFAKIGGSVKEIPQVRKVKFAGIESNGLICSAYELGINDDHSGILSLGETFNIGDNIKDVLPIDDVIIEIDNKSLTNRPDLWGTYGMAREVAAILRRELKPLHLEEFLDTDSLPEVNVKIHDPKTFRYSCVSIDDINNSTLLGKIQIRLYYCGIRPLSLIVDLTNYVMLELGQPMHAFDRNKISGIVVKSFPNSIDFVTLDGIKRQVPADTTMICDQKTPIAVAGVMGGQDSEVTAETISIVLESANFESSSVRKSALAIGLRTEASSRFEKTLDPEMTIIAIKRFMLLLHKHSPGAKFTSKLTDIYNYKFSPVCLKIEKSYIDSYIGNEIRSSRIVEILQALQFNVKCENDNFIIDVPSFRATKDITIKADIVEEILRIYGYDNIIPIPAKVEQLPLIINEERETEHIIREILSMKYAFNEVHSYIWYNNAFNKKIGIGLRPNIEILNPHSKEMNYLRDSMVPMMLEFVENNFKFFDTIPIFEIGSIFRKSDPDNMSITSKNLCLLLSQKSGDERELFDKVKEVVNYIVKTLKKRNISYMSISSKPESFFSSARVKLELIETDTCWIHPIKSAFILLDDKIIGYISILNPAIKRNISDNIGIVVTELYLEELNNIDSDNIKYVEPSKYPEVSLEFSFLVPRQHQFYEFNKYISDFKSDLLIELSYIGQFEGIEIDNAKKSVSYKVLIGSSSHTLSKDEINDFCTLFIQYLSTNDYTIR